MILQKSTHISTRSTFTPHESVASSREDCSTQTDSRTWKRGENQGKLCKYEYNPSWTYHHQDTIIMRADAHLLT